MGFGLPLMLLGLVGVTIPILIHLFNRRRFDVVDWGAMQFLQLSHTTRRRLLLEDVLLLVLRMSLIAAVVCALAAPYAHSRLLAGAIAHEPRDIVLLLDGSCSMGCTATGKTAHDTAKEWALDYIDRLSPGDAVTLLHVKQQPGGVVETTHDLDRVRDAIVKLPAPRGSSDWPLALQQAEKILAASSRPRREIVVLSDGQRFGWADEASQRQWKRLGEQLRAAGGTAPSRWAVNVAPDRPAQVPNWSLAPIRASRAVASVGQQVTFHTALELHGQTAYQPAHRLRLEIDGRHVADVKMPAATPLEKGQVSLSFAHRFPSAGSHLVSLVVEPDPPPDRRPVGYVIKDHLPGDNRQDFALEIVPALPVLLVDGGDRPTTMHAGIDFLRDALSPARDRTPAVLARAIPIAEFAPESLTRGLSDDPRSRPRVLVLADVPRLSPAQDEAVRKHLAQGGGVLLTLGERSDSTYANEHLHAGGQGWLPARLDEVVGHEAMPERAASPLPSSFFHPALELFRDAAAGGLADARFPRWWKVTTPGRGSTAVPVALLSTNDPFLLERNFRGGRVLLATVPLDHSWGTNLPDLPAFAPLAHELVYYLAGARGAEMNLQPGQPLRFHPPGDELPGNLTLHAPEGSPKALTADRWPFVWENTRDTGTYRIESASGLGTWYVVQDDPREADLTPASQTERKQVAQQVPMTYCDCSEPLVAPEVETPPARELWDWLIIAVIVFLCGEIWLTRRMARHR